MEATGKSLDVDPGGIPDELKNLPRWVLWRSVERGGKRTKVPFNVATGRAASSTNPATWTTFDAAWSAYSARPDYWSGTGFVFSKDDSLVGIDLDGILDADGKLVTDWPAEFRAKAPSVPRPAAIVESLNSYCEISPSGTGLHLIVSGTLPTGGNRKGSKSGGLEIYSEGRYFAITGRRFIGTPENIAEVNGELANLHAALFGAAKPTANSAPDAAKPTANSAPNAATNDSEIIKLASEAANGAKFARLWAGDPSGYSSPSEADLALASMLAFWTGPDAERIALLMRSSGLARPKYDSNKGYLTATIAKALEGRTEFFGEQKREKPQSTGSTGRRWNLTIVKSDPPIYRLESPFYDGFVTLSARQYLHFENIRTAALEQKRAFIPASVKKTWNGSKDEPALAGELVASATEIDAPIELDRGEALRERIRDWCASQTRARTKPFAETTLADLPTVDEQGDCYFVFRQLLEGLNKKAMGDERIKKPELIAALSELSVEDISLGRDREKRTVKKIPRAEVSRGAKLRCVEEV